MIILPDLLEKNVDSFQQKLVQAHAYTDRIHIDVIEPSFADNQTVYPTQWPTLPRFLRVDVHLMVKQPLDWLESCMGVDRPLMVAHIEQLTSQNAWVVATKQTGVGAGLAVDLDTPLSTLDPSLLTHVDQILLMAVKAGHAGQVFNPDVLEKIKRLRHKYGYTAEICVDGGITINSARRCLEAGADVLAVNSWLWEDFEARYWQLTALR